MSALANALQAPASASTPPLKYDAACRAVAEAKTLDEVRDWEDKAAAVREYTRRAGNRSLELDAIEIRERARRRRGELLLALKVEGRLRDGKRSSADDRLTLEQLGVSKDQSSRDQAIAKLDGDTFERLLSCCRSYAEEHPEKHTFGMLQAEKKQAKRVREATAYEARTGEGCTVADLEKLAADGAQFGCIYADPPWDFKTFSDKGKDRSADRHFNTSCLDVIKALGRFVSKLAAKDCVLLMWAVMPQLPGVLEVINAWGFTHKTVGFSWVKQNKNGNGLFWGTGYWTRANVELCLLATKGSPCRLNTDVHQVLMAPIVEHSRKPDEVRERIERLVGGPYLELYARRERPGWTTWGDEISRKQFTAISACPTARFDRDLRPVTEDPTDDGLTLPHFLQIGHPENTWLRRSENNPPNSQPCCRRPGPVPDQE
jgi:N6-adenosine-specific RNA methylase IME4